MRGGTDMTTVLPHGYRNAKIPLLIVFILGDFAQGNFS